MASRQLEQEQHRIGARLLIGTAMQKAERSWRAGGTPTYRRTACKGRRQAVLGTRLARGRTMEDPPPSAAL